ncbi:MAG: cupin domain-containing protein [Alphaproteobacteria bacterium]|nr:cupin domain-containing protein [Alphaproteobacteria bacterium]
MSEWNFVHNEATNAEWKEGLRNIFDYRDLGIKAGTDGDYIAHIVKANGRKMEDEVNEWHVHDCTFQFVMVLQGWARFEYAGQGERTIRKGDAILQTPQLPHREIDCSEDFEVLEIVAPANFETRVVDAPA